MGWGRYLLFGGAAQPFGPDEHDSDLRRLRGSMITGRDVERNQDANIEALWAENHELKIYLRALIHLLISKKLLDAEEIATMVRTIERSAGPDPRPPSNAPAGAGDTSPELQDLSKAVEDSRHS